MSGQGIMIQLDPVINIFLTDEENAMLLDTWVSLHHMNCLLIRQHPLEVVKYTVAPRITSSNYQQAWLDSVPLSDSERTYSSLAVANRGCFIFRFPKRIGNDLVDGSIGSVAESIEKNRLYSDLAQSVLDCTSDGMWVYNSGTKRLFYSTNHRCSAGAADLHSQGIRLRAESGFDVFFPSKPSTETIQQHRLSPQ